MILFPRRKRELKAREAEQLSAGRERQMEEAKLETLKASTPAIARLGGELIDLGAADAWGRALEVAYSTRRGRR